MRSLPYLSPTSISKWRKDRSEFYLTYLADHRPPRIPQNQAMSIGAAFDAYVKAYLHSRLYGPGSDPKFDFTNLFEEQVEPHNRDWAKTHGGYVFATYRKSGALSNLMLELADADGPPKFEFRVEGRVAHSSCVSGVPLLGIPDISFYNKQGVFFEYDWKVNGYCSKKTTSPKKGYVRLFEQDGAKKPSHKDCHLMEVDGVLINIAHTLDQIDLDWANQLCIYSWIAGAEVGSKFTVGIDQIVAKGSGTDFPILRVACHRSRISIEYQKKLLDDIADIWTRINAGPKYIFDDHDEDYSKGRCEVLDQYYRGYQEEHKHGSWFEETTRQHKNF